MDWSGAWRRGDGAAWWTVTGVALLASLPFMVSVSGDAQVHLVVAENLAAGRPFQFNPGGESVLASTSPFWSLLLALFYQLAGAATPLLLKVTVAAIWLATAGLLRQAAARLWGMDGVGQLAVAALWLGHSVVVANALSGMENGLVAFQLLWLYQTLYGRVRPWRGRDGLALGLWLGWMALTRPDGGLFGLLLLAVYLWPRRRTWRPLGLAAPWGWLAVTSPYYLYQWQAAGQLLSDSGLARLYAGRQGAWPLAPGWIFLHPKPLVSLLTAFAPLAIGAAWLAVLALRRRADAPAVAALWLLGGGLFFYTVLVGGEAFGRYFLPFFPFLFLGGVAGWRRLGTWCGRRRPGAAALCALLAALLLVASSAADAYRRLGPGRSDAAGTAGVLEVIYGPARQQYYSVNLADLWQAPSRRATTTDSLLQTLSAAEDRPVHMAVTEVQLRYYLDGRFRVLSLDGRASADILPYFEPTTGIPDFAAYLAAARPNYVHVAQWCAVGGWLASFQPTPLADNLLCRWQQQAAGMDVGEAFQWKGNIVRLAAPDIMHISWTSGDADDQ